MTVALYLAMAGFDPGTYLFDRCARAHQALPSAEIHVVYRSAAPGSSNRQDYRLAYERGKGLVIDTEGLAPRRILVGDGKFAQVDHSRKRYASGDLGSRSLLDGLRLAGPGLDAVLTSQFEPHGVRQWLEGLGPATAWRLKPGAGLTLTRKTPEGLLTLKFDGRTGLLSESRGDLKYSQWSWRLRVVSRRPRLALAVPSDYRRVTNIDEATLPPTYLSASARQVAEAMFRQFDSPQRLGLEVTAGNETRRLWVVGPAIRQSDAQVDLLYDGKSMTMLDRGRQEIVRGEASLAQVVRATNKAGGRLDPILRLLARGVNPMRFAYGNGTHIREVGTLTVDGGPAMILESKPAEGGTASTFMVRKRDNALISASSQQTTALGSAYVHRFRTLAAPSRLGIERPPTARAVAVRDYLDEKRP